jgi:Rrf2 family transcriptional regulator, iron-sulfur cluster assembly transcription factor
MATADLAKFGAGQAVPLSAIAGRQSLPVAYLEQIFAQLRKAELVVSERGRSGGYRLARPAAAISIAEIMSAVEEDTKLTRCDAGTTVGCVKDERCLTHQLWFALGQQIEGFLSKVSLQDVANGAPLSGHLATHSASRGPEAGHEREVAHK